MNERVIWVGTAPCAALAVACPTCNAALGAPCTETVFKGRHDRREWFANTLGFRDVLPPGELFNTKDP